MGRLQNEVVLERLEECGLFLVVDVWEFAICPVG